MPPSAESHKIATAVRRSDFLGRGRQASADRRDTGTSGRGLRHGSQPHAYRLGPGSQLLVPNGEERFGGADYQQAPKGDRVCASQGVSTG